MAANMSGQILHCFLGVITAGVWPLYFIWTNKVWKSVRYTKCPIEEAEYLVVTTAQGKETVLEIQENVFPDRKSRPFVIYKYGKFVYEDDGKWRAVRQNFAQKSNSQVRNEMRGLTQKEQGVLSPIYGINSTKIKVENWLIVILRDSIDPMTIYQLASVTVWWAFRDYAVFSIFILILILLEVLLTAYYIIAFQKRINTMVDSVQIAVQRRKPKSADMKSLKVRSENLVPGDIIEIPSGIKLPCDVILLDGTALVDESLLTGETVPQYKSSLPNNEEKFNEDSQKNQSVLMAGTTPLLSTNHHKDGLAIGVVYQTGFSTVKGRLIRNILYEEISEFLFEKNGKLWYWILLGLALLFIAVFLIISFAKYRDLVDGK